MGGAIGTGGAGGAEITCVGSLGLGWGGAGRNSGVHLLGKEAVLLPVLQTELESSPSIQTTLLSASVVTVCPACGTLGVCLAPARTSLTDLVEWTGDQWHIGCACQLWFVQMLGFPVCLRSLWDRHLGIPAWGGNAVLGGCLA